ncbi:hypothetical protein ABW20_dc0104513 [Dactylellina cionopaga]|nr:hypothetical protein ABW20_dc0104513 [Dactylellina cionopaga]
MTFNDLKRVQGIKNAEIIELTGCRLKNLRSDWRMGLQSLRDVRFVLNPYFDSDPWSLTVSGSNNDIKHSKKVQRHVTLNNIRKEIIAGKKVLSRKGVDHHIRWKKNRLAAVERVQTAWRWYEYETKEFRNPELEFDAEGQKVKDKYDKIIRQLQAAG